MRERTLAMTLPTSRIYPDISDILERKARARRNNASRSFAEKIDVLEAMRERVAPIIRARKARKDARAAAASKPKRLR